MKLIWNDGNKTRNKYVICHWQNKIINKDDTYMLLTITNKREKSKILSMLHTEHEMQFVEMYGFHHSMIFICCFCNK